MYNFMKRKSEQYVIKNIPNKYNVLLFSFYNFFSFEMFNNYVQNVVVWMLTYIVSKSSQS